MGHSSAVDHTTVSDAKNRFILVGADYLCLTEQTIQLLDDVYAAENALRSRQNAVTASGAVILLLLIPLLLMAIIYVHHNAKSLFFCASSCRCAWMNGYQ